MNILMVTSEAAPFAKTGGLAAGLDDLPLFAAAMPEPPKADPLQEAVAALDADSMSPREALDLLYELQREAGKLP